MTDNSTQSPLDERMAQASLLPEHDPVRIAVIGEISAQCAREGGEQGPTGKKWAALLKEANQVKAALDAVPIPLTLEKRLLGIPEMTPAKANVPWHQRPISELFTPRRLAIAAGLVIVIAAGWGVWMLHESRQFDRVAVLAADLHGSVLDHPPAARLDTSDSPSAQAWLQTRTAFHDLLNPANTHLTGAAVVNLGSAPAALTRWEKDGHIYSLLEFDPKALGLPAAFPEKKFDSAALGVSGPPRQIILWAEPTKGCAWALVMDAAAPNTFTY